MNHEIHCLIDPESSQEKEAYDLEITGESTNIGKKIWEERCNTWGFSRCLSVKNYYHADRQFRPWKEDIESSQKDPKGEGIIFSHWPHIKKSLHVFVLLVCIPSNRRVSLPIHRLENPWKSLHSPHFECKTHLRSITFQPSLLAVCFIYSKSERAKLTKIIGRT